MTNSRLLATVVAAVTVTFVVGPSEAAMGAPLPLDRRYKTSSEGCETRYSLPLPRAAAIERLYIVEQAGRIRIADGSRLLPKPFLDIRGKVRSAGLQGMFSLAFDPRYERNHRFFVNYVGRDGNVHVASFRTRKGMAVPRSHRNVLTVPTINKDPYSHYGGALVFGPDGRLYASFGDSGDGGSSQRDSTLLGKLVRIDVAHPARRPSWSPTGSVIRGAFPSTEPPA